MYVWINVFVLIFIRILAATLHGRQTKSCNFTEILKVQKIKISHRPSVDKVYFFFHYFAQLGFDIAEYKDRSITYKKKKKKCSRGGGGGRGGVCPGK